MVPNSSAERTLALRLLAEAGATSEASDPAALTESVCRQLASELTRWFGPFGYHALLSRALAHAKTNHPALAGVRVRSASEPSLEGLPESLQHYGADVATEAVVVLLMTFIELLGRLIGPDMAQRLIAQSVPARGTDVDFTKDGES